jgi:hypothetical protein
MLSSAEILPRRAAMPPRDSSASALLSSFTQLTSQCLTVVVQKVLVNSRLPRDIVTSANANPGIRTKLVALGGGMWLAPRLGLDNYGSPRVYGAIFFKPLMPLGDHQSFRWDRLGHLVYRRVFLRLLLAVAPLAGSLQTDLLSLLALYNSLSPAFSLDTAKIEVDHTALISEFVHAGFAFGASFVNSSRDAPRLFLALMRGMPTEMGLSEVHEELFSHFLSDPVEADFEDGGHSALSREFCSRVLRSARALPYGCERMRFLRSFAEVNTAFSAPMPELTPWPLELESLLQATVSKFKGPRVVTAPMPYDRLRHRAQNLLQELQSRYLDRSHSAAMYRYFNRVYVEALHYYPLDNCDVRHFRDWFDKDGFLRFNREEPD